MNLKLIIILLCVYTSTSQCYNFSEETNAQYVIPLFTIKSKMEAIVYDKDNATDHTLIQSILSQVYAHQSVLLIRNDVNFVPRIGNYSKTPKLIILTKTLRVKDLESNMFRHIIKACWEPLYIIITSRNPNETCVNGTFNDSFIGQSQFYLNLLWHKYKVPRVLVSFPIYCPEHYIVYDGKNNSNGGLYDRTIKVIKPQNNAELQNVVIESGRERKLSEGYPLKTNIFYRFPTAITECAVIDRYIKVDLEYSNNFCGMDGLVLNDFIRHYKFDWTAVESKQCNSYGYEKPGSYDPSGTLDCIVRGEVDVSFNSRFLVHYKSNFFYLHYIKMESLCVVLKKPDLIPIWHYSYRTFDGVSKLLLVASVLIMGAMAWFTDYYKKKMYGLSLYPLYVYLTNAAVTILIGFTIKKCFNNRFRILLGASFFAAINFMALFQGNVNYQFTTRKPFKALRTLQELYESTVKIYTSPPIFNIMMPCEDAGDELLSRYMHNMVKIGNIELEDILDNPNLGTLTRKSDVRMEILLNYTDSQQRPLIYVMDQCFSNFYLSYIAGEDFLFAGETHKFMMRLLEAGLPEMYYTWTRRTFHLGDAYPNMGVEARPAQSITITDIRFSFAILACGFLLSLFVFIIEIWKSKHQSHRVST